MNSLFLRLKVYSHSRFASPLRGTPNYFGIRYCSIKDGNLQPNWSISCLTGYVTIVSFPFNLQDKR